jgi:hypothetical protein
LDVRGSPGHRAVYERQADPANQGGESGADNVRDSRGLDNEAVKFRENRAVTVGLIIDVPPSNLATHKAARGQPVEFSLHGSLAHAGMAYDLADVERLVRTAKEQRQQSATCSPKQGLQQVSRVDCRTHNGDNCTDIGYIMASGFSPKLTRANRSHDCRSL